MQFPIPAPRNHDGTLLPAVLVGVLIATAVLQIWLAGGSEPLVASGGLARLPAYVPPRIADVRVPMDILAKPIFSPARTRDGGSAGNESDPLAGAQVAGAMTVRGRPRLFLRGPDGSATTLYPGETLNGWTLLTVTREGARFGHGNETALIPYGASAPHTSSNTEDQPEEEQ